MAEEKNGKLTGTGFSNEKPNTMKCFDCGGEFELKLPLPTEIAAKLMKAFDQLHKYCKENSTTILK